MVRVFPKSANQPKEMAPTICNLISRNCFWPMRVWKLESLANGKEISAVPFRMEKEEYLGSWGRMDFGKYSRGCSRTVSFDFEQSQGAYHLSK